MIETPCRRIDHADPRRPAVDGGGDREFEIRCVLVAIVALDRGRRRLDLREQRTRYRVEVADEYVDVETERRRC